MTRARRCWVRSAAAAAVVAGAAMALPAGVASASTSPAHPRTTIILLDVNNSLVNGGFAAEQQAALAYAKALPADVQVGLISFSSNWQWLLAPSTDRSSLATAVAAAKQTAITSAGLHAALGSAEARLTQLGAASGSTLVVLSDAEVLRGPPLRSSWRTDVVTWYYESDDHLGRLRELASTSGGQAVKPRNVAALAASFPPLPAPTVTPTHASAAAPAAPVRHAASPASWRLIVALGLVFAALLLLALLLVGSALSGDRRRHLVAQIERYGPRHTPKAASGDRSLARTAVDLTTQLLESGKRTEALAQRLDLAAINRKPAEWVLLAAAVSVGVAALLTLLTRNVLIGLLVGILAGWAGQRLIVSLRISRRRTAFAAQLPDVLQFVVGSIRSGFSLGQALDAAVREDTQPAAGEFRRALAEARVGVDLDVALAGVADRMASTDLHWTVMAIRIQREVGGNLAEVLENTIGTMRERAYLHRQIRSLSAEGRLSAYVLIALPLLMGGWLLLTDRRYLSPLYTTAIGVTLLVISLALFGVGVFWMRAVVKVEV